MEYNFNSIEQKWRKRWADNNTYKVSTDSNKEKFYVLDMFPYPSGAGLHVGHPLGYIASDVYARYKRLQGFNVLHPMGYDSFGLPAEQYAIQTGQHPELTTKENIARYRDQLDKIGFSYDWSREVRTSSPEYYKWTQWIFIELFNSWYDKSADKARSITDLIALFEKEGNASIQAVTDQETVFTAAEWNVFSKEEKEAVLQNYRLTYLADSWVNWCPALGTVLANDEVVNGVSERGGHPVEQKLMRQWSMRIKAYAERLLTGLDSLDWTDSIKDIQTNWIGKSKGASVFFPLWRGIEGEDTSKTHIEVFTTRPDTIFGVTFLVLAPEHPLVDVITTTEYADKVAEYKRVASLKSERDRQSDVKNITGQITGAKAIHPFTGAEVDIWIADYVLASYGTGAVMAVPCGDQRDWDFATHFNIPIKNIFQDKDISKAAYTEKDALIAASDFLTGLEAKVAIEKAIEAIENKGIGKGKTNYRLRDAVFSRQRYWGEPFPIYYKNGLPQTIAVEHLPIVLPEVEKYLPTEDGQPPLGNATVWAWDTANNKVVENSKIDHQTVFPLELNTMPGWAGSSWYFLRYTDPLNTNAFAAKDAVDYWKNVDLYMGGAEHATGHLLYARFWTKFLYDRGYIPFEEPFQKMINQGMILGRSSFVYRIKPLFYYTNEDPYSLDKKIDIDIKKNVDLNMELTRQMPPIFITYSILKKYLNDPYSFSDNNFNIEHKRILKLIKENVQNQNVSVELSINDATPIHVDISLVDNDKLDLEGFKKWRSEYANAEFILENDGTYICGHEVEKMSKSKYNVQTPDELVEKYGADTLRCYEMFLGPVEQAKPWDTKGINGVSNFLRKLWRLFNLDENGSPRLDEGEPSKDNLKSLHKTIKKVSDDLERFSFNTCVSNFMICVNELSEQKCTNKQILEQLLVLVSPYAPHIAEELWEKMGNGATSVTQASFPTFNEAYLVEDNIEYPVSFNGKMRFKMPLAAALSPKEVEEIVLNSPEAAKYLEGKTPKKVIVVPGKIVNIVM
ncbi:MAG: leucine--tRNA ligase [Crocinitomicaceae bacterium]|nr:leucine--tRNA ligase [Crocinitomicaceae bacterium]